MNNKKIELFKLIDAAYNELPEEYSEFIKVLFSASLSLHNDGDYQKIVAVIDNNGLKKLTAAQRSQIPEIRAIAEFIAPDIKNGRPTALA